MLGAKHWIRTIHGLRCTKHGSVLCKTIHGLPAQSIDCVNRRAQSMDLAKPWIQAGRYCILLLDQWSYCLVHGAATMYTCAWKIMLFSDTNGHYKL